MERLRHLRGEAGASSVELLVFFPLLLLIILLAVQTGLSWYGNEVAMTAARETARTLRTGAHDDAALAAARADGAAAREALGYQAVLCNPLAAQQYGLGVLAGGVADNPDAVTRFVMVTRPGWVGEPTGADKTTLLVQLPHDRSGALLSMLEQFSARGVNLTRIESRPVGDSLGRYRFSIDAEGHIREERLQAAFIGLHRTCPVVRFLGSYPRLDARPVVVPAGTSDKDFVVARAWVADVLAGRTL